MMNLEEKRIYLIEKLLEEDGRYRKMQIPTDETDQRQLLRSLMNVRPASPAGEEFLRIQDEYLKEIGKQKGIVCLSDLEETAKDMYLWQGDITRLKVGAIVNAANSGMTGCYRPCHNCIDNCIHTYAGIELRSYCADMMEKQGYEEPAGLAKITPAFNLPCDYVIHTVGPIVEGRLSEKHEKLLVSCYRSCLEIADRNRVESIAFCCISTGVFGFPKDRACAIAVRTVKDYKKSSGSGIKVIFNVFKEDDYVRYKEQLTHGKN